MPPIPTGAARRATSTVVTGLGPDRGALRAADRDAELVDLGIGTSTVDVCIRTADPELLALLRAAQGRPQDAELNAAVVAAGPHRVFTTAVGRVEVYAPAGAHGSPAPSGAAPTCGFF